MNALPSIAGTGTDSSNDRRPTGPILDEQGSGISSGAADSVPAPLADSAPDIDAAAADAGTRKLLFGHHLLWACRRADGPCHTLIAPAEVRFNAGVTSPAPGAGAEDATAPTPDYDTAKECGGGAGGLLAYDM